MTTDTGHKYEERALPALAYAGNFFWSLTTPKSLKSCA